MSQLERFLETYVFQQMVKELEKWIMPTKLGAKTVKDEEDLTADDFPNTQIERRGKQIIVPEGMPLPVAREWLRRRENEEDAYVGIHETIHSYPLDGAHAFALALAEIYGFTELKGIPGFFGSTPPTMVSVQTNVNETVKVPWGRMVIPDIEGILSTETMKVQGRPVFAIGGEVKNKHRSKVDAIIKRTKELVISHSIYKGKPLQMHFPDYNSENFDPSTDMPRFFDTGNLGPNNLILSEATQKQIDISIFAPIRHWELLKKLNKKLKRGILLHGTWGVGKTLTAKVTAALCRQYGWTFIYLVKVEQLARAIEFARYYQRTFIFAEDFDRIAGQGRDDVLNNLLNVIDGVVGHNDHIMVALTTNRIGKIDPSVLRHGRIDAVIPMEPPDAEAAIRLVRLYAKNSLAPDVDLREVGEALKNKLPAVIEAVVEHSTLAAIDRMSANSQEALTLDTIPIEASDLLKSAAGMEKHLELLVEQKEDKRSDIEKAASVIASAIDDLNPNNGEQAERKRRQLEKA